MLFTYTLLVPLVLLGATWLLLGNMPVARVSGFCFLVGPVAFLGLGNELTLLVSGAFMFCSLVFTGANVPTRLVGVLAGLLTIGSAFEAGVF